MRTFLVYVKLELKRALRFLLWIAAGAMVLAGLLGSIALFAFRTVESGAKLDKLKVGVVVPEEDGLAKKAVSMLGTLDSVESICQFVFTEEADGKKRTEAGEFACLMEVPEDFVGSIIDGSNHPVTIWFPRPLGVEEQVFKELAEAGARTLSSAQAGIYAAGHMNGLYGIPASIQEAERYLNTKYLSYSLDREGYFRRLQVSSAGDVSTEVHYMAAAAVFFLLLSGIPAGRLFAEDSRSRQEKLKLLGIGTGSRIVAKAAAMTVLLFLLTGFLAIAAAMAGFFLKDAGLSEALSSILAEIGEKSRGTVFFRIGLAAAVFAASASLIVLCYSLSGTLIGGMMALFLGTCGMMVISGGFLPEVFLPQSFQKLSEYLPTTALLSGIKGFFQSGENWSLVVRLWAVSAGSLVIAGVRKGGRA